MKAHVGVDAASGMVHTVIGNAGNVADVTHAHAMLHGEEPALPKNKLGRLTEELEHLKASVREIEHPIHVLMNLFRHHKTR